MKSAEHWDAVYRKNSPDQVSWFRPHLESSLNLVARVAPDHGAAIIDVGGGTSTLVDDLSRLGYRNVTVLDISETALNIAKERVGEAAEFIRWLQGDVTEFSLPARAYDVWHDRAVFHFLTEDAQRAKYVKNAASAVKPGGHVIVSTFGREGPVRCSGLDVVRYDGAALQREFGPRFVTVESFNELHATPFGTTQQFLCWHAIRQD